MTGKGKIWENSRAPRPAAAVTGCCFRRRPPLQMNELALFAGAGGGILGGHLLGWRTICAVEWDAYAASVLVQRQNDGSLPAFPIWDDVQTFDGRPWRGRIDVISGGFPCQDISSAGKGAGINGERSGMWGHMARIVGEVRPRFVFVENSPLLVGRGLARVLGSLASLGYDARWGVLGARDAGAPHKRDRIWIVAHAYNHRQSPSCGTREGSRESEKGDHSGRSSEDVADSEIIRLKGSVKRQNSADSPRRELAPIPAPGSSSVNGTWWPTESDMGRGLPAWMAGRVDINGTDAQGGLSRVGKNIPHRVDRLKCIGNGQVPQCAALAWRILNEWT